MENFEVYMRTCRMFSVLMKTVLTLTDFGVPLMSHRYTMWYFRGTMSKLDQVGGGDHSTSKFLT